MVIEAGMYKRREELPVEEQRKGDEMNREKRLAGVVMTAILLSMAMGYFPTPASAADDKMEEDQLVEKARMAFDSTVD